MIRDQALGEALLQSAAVRGHVVGGVALAGVGGGLATHEVPLYIVSMARPGMAPTCASATRGVYGVVDVQRQHRLAAALLQRDLVTCAVVDTRSPYRVALPVRVHTCAGGVEHAVLTAVIRVYVALRWRAAHRRVLATLVAYYAYVVRCVLS